jgi:uncharacterized RDD family membrane protein YckC
MPYCATCGSPVADEAHFCPNCGGAVAPQVRYAGFWRRVGSTVIDSLILGIPVAFLAEAFFPGSRLADNIFVLALGALYGPGLLASAGRTLGMRVTHTKVTTLSGERLTFPHAVGRYALRLGIVELTQLANLVSHPNVPAGTILTQAQTHAQERYLGVAVALLIPLVVDLWWMRRGDQRQTLHDALSRSVMRIER